MRNYHYYNLLIVLPLAILVIFFYYPILFILQKAFVQNGSFTFDVFTNIFQQNWQRSVIFFTFKQAILSLFFTLLIGLPITLVFSYYDFPFKDKIRAVLMVPFVLPGISVALGFILFYGQQGFVNKILSFFNLNIQILYSLKAILMAHVFYNVPLLVKMLCDTLESFNSNLIISSRTLGANRFISFFKVTIPCIMPALINVSVLIFLYCFMSFGIVLVLGDIKYTTIEVNIFIFVKHLLETEKGIALSCIQVLISLIMLTLSSIFTKKNERVLGLTKGPKQLSTPLFKKINSLKVISIIVLSLFLVFIISPLLSIFVYSFKTFLLFLTKLFQFDPYIGTYTYQPILNSVILGSLVALISLIISLLFRISLSHCKYRKAIESLILLPLGISGITFSLGYLFIFKSAMHKPFILLVIAQSIICLPFCYSSISAAIDSVGINLIHSAQSLGAGMKKTYIKVVLPLIYK
ncbi:MAG: iron ABC transporter permease, partial [Candidatus Cloacimonadales bacterium]|nr:iron ABC transporter permease [Candidatus Cloacimonadales bacterium]